MLVCKKPESSNKCRKVISTAKSGAEILFIGKFLLPLSAPTHCMRVWHFDEKVQ